MVCIEHISTYIPENVVSIDELQEYLNLKAYQVKLFKKIHGLKEIRMDNKKNLLNLLFPSIKEMLEATNTLEEEIKYVIYCNTIQNIYPYPKNIFQDIKKIFPFKNAICFSVTQQNCASSLVALDIAESLLINTESNREKILIITGEKVFTPSAQLINNTTIMGEASAAVLLSKDSINNKVLNTKTQILGKYADGLSISEENQKDFEKIYVPTLAKLIEDTVAEADLRMEDISLILPHNVNYSSWKSVSKALNYPISKIYLENVSRLGHCFCSDPFINYESAVRDNMLSKDDYYLMVSVGLGATFAVTLIQH